MISFAKALYWGALCRMLSAGASQIRRRKLRFGPAEWRSAAFSFSQLGEDCIIGRLFETMGVSAGTYVDVGAYDPVQYSNTLNLHRHGWSGVNIDASATTIAAFEAARPGDTNIRAAVSDEERSVRFLEYPARATNRIASGDDEKSVIGEQAIGSSTITTRTLSSILLEHGVQRIDFLNIDCEGEDFRVLKSLDFRRWRPRVIAIEAHNDSEREAVSAHLRPLGYGLVARMLITEIYRDESPASAPPPRS